MKVIKLTHKRTREILYISKSKIGDIRTSKDINDAKAYFRTSTIEKAISDLRPIFEKKGYWVDAFELTLFFALPKYEEVTNA